ncbi:MAG: trypsin-like peptidase domain-containing protein, partial [Thermoleophilaceae bacterium]|nr:trypsin-like peptidase domain-containing protein [Thermoleophilaceae bacterium]
MNAIGLATRFGVGIGVLAASSALAGCSVPSGTLDDFIQGPGAAGVEAPRRASATQLNSSSVYRRSSPSVVTVITDIDGDGEAEGLGSGFAVGTNRIATNVHVIADLDFHREAERVWVQLRNGERFQMQIVGTDSHADVALLRFAGSNNKHGPVRLRPLKLTKTNKLAVGEPVAAIGAPLGETNSMSVGQVSGIERTIEGLAGFNITGAIQTDAAITLGNSGGPL